MWTAVEIDLGVICASLATLKPLVKKLVAERTKSKARSNFDYVDNGLDYVETPSEAKDPKQVQQDEIPLRGVSKFYIANKGSFDGLAMNPVSAAAHD